MSGQQMLIATVGLPGSGKTTWAGRVVTATGGSTVRWSWDTARDMMFGGIEYTTEVRDLLREVMIATTQAMAGSERRSVIVDNTNLVSATLAYTRGLADRLGLPLVAVDLTEVPYLECVARDQRRERSIGEKAIQVQALRAWHNTTWPALPPDPPDGWGDYITGGPAAADVSEALRTRILDRVRDFADEVTGPDSQLRV